MTHPRTPDPAAMYQVLAESAPDPILTIDEASVILSVNAAAERVFGYTAAEMVGQSLHMLMPERLQGGHDAGMGRYLRTGERRIPWHGVRVPIRTKSGTEVPVEISFGEFVADGRRLFSGFLRDITAQRQAEDRLGFLGDASRVLSASLEVTPTLRALAHLVVPGLADYCHVDLVDPATDRIERVAVVHVDPAKQVRMDEVAQHLPPQDTPGYATVQAIRSGRSRLESDLGAPFRAALAGQPGLGTMVAVLDARSFVVAPLEARGRVIGAMILVATPESGRRYGAGDLAMVEEVARRAAVAVDNARLYQESERARAAAEAANRAKDQFVATMSHELRTPLNAIGGYTELMEMGIRGPVTEAQLEDLRRIKRSQQHLLALVEDVLGFARLQAGAVELEIADVPLAEAFADLDALVRPQVDAKSLHYQPCTPPPGTLVRADRDRLVQVLVNLVGNSVKFTPEGGEIRISCEVHAAQVEMRVSDSGIGIPLDQLERVFEPFTQVHEGLTRNTGGAGLGLAISRDLARAMGGELHAERPAAGGATLVLVLPRGGGA